MLTLRPIVLSFVLAASSFGCNSEPASTNNSPPKQEEPQPTIELSYNTDGSGFAEALAALDTEIEKTAARAAEQADSWLVRDKLAQLYMARARLSGDYGDYQKAERALGEAFGLAPEGAGPVLTRAALNFTLHRLDPIETDLAAAEGAILVDNPTRAHISSVRGDVAFQRGQYAEAHTLYLAALELKRSPAILAKLAQWTFRTGDFEAADELFREAEAKMLPDSLEGRAWSQLQLGILDLERGRFAEAFAHYRDGTEILGGWWLLEEHIAEIAVLDGQTEFALALYEDIIERTHKGEFMDAKAALLREAGDEAGAQAMIDAAEAVYQEQLEQFPEASYGHALDHYLEFGPASRALELAEQNHTLRPGVPAKIALAQARLGVEDLAGAQTIIDEALATPWVSAELYWVGHEVYAALEDTTRAAELRAQAVALDPTPEQ